MRAEEGDESINEFADEADQARRNVAPRASWWKRLWRSLLRRRVG